MKSWWTFASGVVGGILGAGLVWLIASPPRGEAVTLRPPPTPAPLTVHVAGAVTRPGVYQLPPGSRVAEALEAAGGALPTANTAGLNLAARLEDGDQVRVLLEAQSQATPATAPPPGSMAGADPGAGALVDINLASQAELESLPGIGPATATKIIEYRETHGPFASIEAIQKVSGIGPATFRRIQDLITVGPAP